MLGILGRLDKSDIVVIGVWILFIIFLQKIVAPWTLTELFVGMFRFMGSIRY